jgi:hypothetical protein
MLQLIQRWLTGASSSTWDLSAYPAHEPPHAGYGAALSEAQAQQNRAWFEATRAERLRVARDWLVAHQGPDLHALSGLAYAKALNAWARQHWPQLPPANRLPAHKAWPDGPRHGPLIIYSLLGDIALTLGESIRLADPHWRWGLNLDAADLADGMHSSRRVVLLADLKRPTPEAREAVLDLEAQIVHDYRHPDSPNFQHLDSWARTAADAIAGRYYDF